MAITREQVKLALYSQGITLPEWAARHKISVNVANEVMYRNAKATRGEAHRCAVLLGVKDGVIGVGRRSIEYRDGRPLEKPRRRRPQGRDKTVPAQ